VKRLLTPEQVREAAAAGKTRVSAPRASTVVTPQAWSVALELGVTIDQATTPAAEPARAAPTQGRSEREVDASGVVVVRGQSVELTPFPAAGPGKRVGMADLITSRDGAPMTAGLMSWGRADSFAWKLDYDEVDLVLEGVLHLTIDGRVIEARPGDVLYIPKGSAVVFGTPWRTKVFYVTYPADWAAAPSAPPRPQR
jgi:ethanolamine utilization protein EutQ